MSEPTAPVALRGAADTCRAGAGALMAGGHSPLTTQATPTPAPERALP
ncbi:hypothetical protein [Streptomyces sp. Y7]